MDHTPRLQPLLQRENTELALFKQQLLDDEDLGYDRMTEDDDIRAMTYWSDPLCRRDFFRFRRELPQLIAAFTVYCVGVYTNSVTQAYLQKHADRFHKEHVLSDIGFRNLPKMDIILFKLSYSFCSFELDLPDFMAGVVTICMMVRYLILPGPLSMRWTILRRLLFLSGVMYFLRAFSIVSTVLPNPDHTCKCYVDNRICTDDDLENVWAFAFLVFQTRAVTCEDVLFSGHTVAVTISMMFVLEYEHKLCWYPFIEEGAPRRVGACTYKFLTMAWAGLSYVCIIGSRFHYTADVLLGFLLTVMTCTGYSNMTKDALVRREGLLASCVQWFEKHASDLKVWHKKVILDGLY